MGGERFSNYYFTFVAITKDGQENEHLISRGFFFSLMATCLFRNTFSLLLKTQRFYWDFTDFRLGLFCVLKRSWSKPHLYLFMITVYCAGMSLLKIFTCWTVCVIELRDLSLIVNFLLTSLFFTQFLKSARQLVRQYFCWPVRA